MTDFSTAAGVVQQFAIYGEFRDITPYGGGHINDTFMSRWDQAGTVLRYLHQRINHHVFVHPDRVMENIRRVTAHIREKLRAAGETGWIRRTLTVIPARDGSLLVRDTDGFYWRTYLFIEHAHTTDVASSADEVLFLGSSVGYFQKQLADLGQPRLYDTIPDFHNMEKRYEKFYGAVSADVRGRVKETGAEIAFMKENEQRGGILVRALRDGRIPERICHNDTKMNNIMIDDADCRALCVVDLDTVMPGTSLFDVGDLIRTAANRVEEDERNLPDPQFDIDFFEVLLKGYLSEARDFLTSGEKALIAESGRNITHIMALRFLTDYLEGDHYYHTSRPDHNLDRCRNQIGLIRSMDSQWEEAAGRAEKLCR
ncbi:MAG: aminoglycoside phosphotransferase family protein [Treponema sp.]|nr:aminoglycoside phosphotransferase family protein [Treponema sp.]